MSADELTAYLHRNIPLTAAMALTVVRCDAEALEIRAPLAPNLNHRNTAFGGSLATLGIVSGWALLHTALTREEIAARIVVQKSEADFARAVEGDFTATTRLPAAEWPRFVETLRRKGRARIAVATSIAATDQTAVTHVGTYVALAPP